MYTKLLFFVTLSAAVCFTSCGSEDDMKTTVEAPATYNFTRDGQSTVSFDGQSTRIAMGEELISAMSNFDMTEERLLEMYANQTASGDDADPYASADLNESTKSIRSKVAASNDLFSANTVDATEIKAKFAAWITAQNNEVFPNENTQAAAGQAGQIADGTSTRYVNAQGLEYNQLVAKGLIGALMADQVLNNYLSAAVLDAGSNVENHEAEILDDGKTYTTMEHKWDEAYGYIYGASADAASPNATIGSDDSFMNKYIGRVNSDEDFSTIADDIYQAFKLGRAAIVAKDYDLRDEQASIIRTKLSEVIAIRAVYYLQQGKDNLETNKGGAFHALSEGFGFVYSLQFAREANSSKTYFTKAEVDNMFDMLLGDGENGLWDVTPATLDAVSTMIADRFEFTVAQAGS